MKKKGYFLLAGMLVISACFTGCGKSDKEDEVISTESVAQESEETSVAAENSENSSEEVVTTATEATDDKEVEASFMVKNEKIENEPYVEPIKNFLDGTFQADTRKMFSAFPQELVEALFLTDTELTYDEFIAAMDEALASSVPENYDFSFKGSEPIVAEELADYENYLKTMMDNVVVSEGYTVELITDTKVSPTRVFLVNDTWTLDFTYLSGESLK